MLYSKLTINLNKDCVAEMSGEGSDDESEDLMPIYGIFGGGDQEEAPGSSTSYLQLPCQVVDTGLPHGTLRTRADYEFAASVFGVSNINEDGDIRDVGYWRSCKCADGGRGVFWRVLIYSYNGVVCGIESNYHVTMIDDVRLDSINRSTTFIIHPVPRNELVDCRLYDPPSWCVYADGGIAGMVQVEHSTVWSNVDSDNKSQQYQASIEAWIPWEANCDKCGKGGNYW